MRRIEESEAHFDAFACPRSHYELTGELHRTVPNNTLTSIGLLPGSTRVQSWSSESHESVNPANAREIQYYRNDQSFRNEKGEALTVYIVTVIDDSLDDH